jgi:SOS-response transcriptional repressor LexA
MSKSHIYKGDMAFIKTGAINESEIALVRVGEDFMVRRIYWDDCRLYIMPDNYKYGQIILQWENPEKEAQIIGKVVNVLTKAI